MNYKLDYGFHGEWTGDKSEGHLHGVETKDKSDQRLKRLKMYRTEGYEENG